MKTKSFKITAGAMALAFATWIGLVSIHAQPMYDRIHVSIPYTITLQNKTLQPGDYTIQQLPSDGGSGRILLFYTDNGMKFETSAMTIPALDPNTARDTKLILNHVGDDYYISKIWVQGKDYGYELPIPDSLKTRQNERMTEATVPATYQPSSTADTTATTSTVAATAPPENANSNNTADTANRPLAEPSTAPATVPTETAQNAQPVAPQPEPTTQPATTDNSANSTMPDQDAAPTTGSANREMPSTAAGWLTMLLSGGVLSGAGLMLQRKR